MRDINSDILHTHFVMNGRRFEDYNRVYYHSNENLKDIFSFIDVKDKNVLTVLGSGDQAFYAYDRGAKSVDMFDKNKLAIYYYYIRLWTIKYLDQYYPKFEFDIRFIRGLLSLVKIKNDEEKEAFNYWCKFVEFFDSKKSEKIFYRGLYDEINRLEDLSKIKKRIKDGFTYYDIDVGKNVSSIRKKYDVVYISNISDYIEPKISSFELYRDNLESLLKENGIIISINLRKLGIGERDLEREVFSDNFDVEELPYIDRYDFKIPAGKVYRK